MHLHRFASLRVFLTEFVGFCGFVGNAYMSDSFFPFLFVVLLSFVGIGKDLVALPSNEDLDLDLEKMAQFFTARAVFWEFRRFLCE